MIASGLALLGVERARGDALKRGGGLNRQAYGRCRFPTTGGTGTWRTAISDGRWSIDRPINMSDERAADPRAPPERSSGVRSACRTGAPDRPVRSAVRLRRNPPRQHAAPQSAFDDEPQTIAMPCRHERRKATRSRSAQPPSWLQSSQNWRQELAASRSSRNMRLRPRRPTSSMPEEQRGLSPDDRYAEPHRARLRAGRRPALRRGAVSAARRPGRARCRRRMTVRLTAYPGHEQGYDDQYAPQRRSAEPPPRRCF